MISGYTYVQDGVVNDYCFEECILSMRAACDEVVVGVAKSDDGTLERVEAIAVGGNTCPVRIVHYERVGPEERNPERLIAWLNNVRRHCQFPYQLALDADEVLPEWHVQQLKEHAKSKDCVWFDRLNFWGDTKRLAPAGHVCGEAVVRAGPTSLWMPSDEPRPEGEPEIRIRAIKTGMSIFHYGFIRKQEAFYRKSKFLQPVLVGSYDQRLVDAEASGKPWADTIEFDRPFGIYNGPHPAVAIQWLKERGYAP